MAVDPKDPNYIDFDNLEECIVMSMPEPGVVSSFWSPTLFPPLKVTTNNVTREIKVVFASVENEDTQLLHKLLSKTRDAK